MESYDNFASYFASMYSHMTLIEENETKYLLIPPNQMDWHFTLTKLSDDEWEVFALREYDFIFDEPWKYTITYTKVNNNWTVKN
jgi:hypothetical protein